MPITRASIGRHVKSISKGWICVIQSGIRPIGGRYDKVRLEIWFFGWLMCSMT